MIVARCVCVCVVFNSIITIINNANSKLYLAALFDACTHHMVLLLLIGSGGGGVMLMIVSKQMKNT